MPVTRTSRAESADRLRRSAAQQIAAFLHGFSVGAVAPAIEQVAALKSALPPRAKVHLTAVPDGRMAKPVEAAVRVRARGLRAGAASRGARHRKPRRARRGVGTADARGRRPASARHRRRTAGTTGPFASAIELIESGLLQRHGISEIGIAGYPEGHPRLSQDALASRARRQGRSGRADRARRHIVTQFAFDAARFWPGWDGCAISASSIRCGSAWPARRACRRSCATRTAAASALRRRTDAPGRPCPSTCSAPARPTASFGRSPKRCGDGTLGRVAAHFFSFGRAAATARWAAGRGGRADRARPGGRFQGHAAVRIRCVA